MSENTITGQLSRISTAATTIWQKAAAMKLNLPAGTYWDKETDSDKEIIAGNQIQGDNSTTERYYISGTTADSYRFGIDASAAAINAINVAEYLGLYENNNISGDQTINAGETVTIPIGYNTTQYQITASNAGAGLRATTAQSYDLFYGKTAYIKDGDNITRITGSISQLYLDTSDYKTQNGTLKLGIYSDTILGSGVSQKYVSVKQIACIEDPTATLDSYTNEGKDYVQVKISKGYYPNEDISTNIPYYSDFATKTIELKTVTTSEGNTTTTANSITIPKGYYTKDFTITPVIKDLTTNEAEDILNYSDINLGTSGALPEKWEQGADYILNPSDSGYDFFNKITVPYAKYNKTNNKYTFTAGWVTEGLTLDATESDLKPLEASVFETSPDLNTNNEIASRAFTVTIPEGYKSFNEVSKTYNIQHGSHSLNVTFADNTKYGTDSNVADSSIESVNKQYFKIADDITVAGWIEAGSNSKYYKVNDFGRGATSASSANYYKVASPGWIKAGQYVGNKPLNISTDTAYSSATKIYDITAKEFKIEQGDVALQEIIIKKVDVGEASYKLSSADCSSDVKLTVKASDDQDGTTSTYMSAITFDMSYILDQLQEI